MTGGDLTALLPFLVMGVAVPAVTLAAAFRRPALAAGLAALGTVLAFAALWPAAGVVPRQVTPLLMIDGYALYFAGLMLAATLAVLLLSLGYLHRRPEPREAHSLLLLLAAFGAMAVAASDHFASFILGLETLSVALLGLIAYAHGRERPIEAGLKYLILAGFSSAILLFGIALLYLRCGSLSFAGIAFALGRAGSDPAILLAFALVIAGIGFKLSLVPFHMWAPDVYQGASAPVAGFIAVVSKGAVFALLLRLAHDTPLASGPGATVIQAIAVATILAGNLLALLQDNFKRLLAYSSIAHFGYLLLAVLAGGVLGAEAAAYYLAAYAVMTLGAFGVITQLSAGQAGDDIEQLSAYRGLMWRRPWLAAVLVLMLFALAGMPLTMGFFAKLTVLMAGIHGGWWPAVGALVAGSVIGLFYYLRVIALMAAGRPVEAVPEPTRWAGALVLAMLTGVLVWLGMAPAPLMALIRRATLGG